MRSYYEIICLCLAIQVALAANGNSADTTAVVSTIDIRNIFSLLINKFMCGDCSRWR